MPTVMAVSCDTDCCLAEGNADNPASKICVTLSATAAADFGASVLTSDAIVWIVPIIKCLAPRWPRWPQTVLALTDCVSRRAVRKVGSGRRKT